jgi:hypothetical protein
MLKQFTTALNKATGFICTSINKLSGVNKPCRQFFSWLFERWWMVPVRYNFLNLSRYGGYSEKTIRNQFSHKFPFVNLFHELFAPLKKKHCIAAFDPTYINKSGESTYGTGLFWSGTNNQVKKGMEAGCLALIDREDHTAYSLEVVQTPAATENLMDHYAQAIISRKEDIQAYTDVLTVDGYFMKEGFINAMHNIGLKVITKARHDSNMRYLYKGPQHKGPGRKKVFDGKVKWNSIDKRRWKVCFEDEDSIAYELVLWSVSLKRKVKTLYVCHKEKKSYAILISTDTALKGTRVLQYYQLRFQIEFLIRDAKTYAGLEHCQARSEEKLYNHFNMAMLSVSAIKWLVWTRMPDKEQRPFSMRSIKTYFINKYLAETIFSKLGLELSCKKIKKVYDDCLSIGSMTP